MTHARPPLRLAIVGFGAIGQALARQLQHDSAVAVSQVVVRPASIAAAQAACAPVAPQARVLPSLDLGPHGRPDLVAECAGHGAVDAHVVPALQAGVPCALASIGALHDDALLARLQEAAGHGHTRLQLIAGAIGGMDALAAAAIGGLDSVTYMGRKPPASWMGTPAEQVCDLTRLTAAQVVFEGPARQAARSFPQNANVAATVSLAGLGLDRTQVRLIADPAVTRNVHAVVAQGAFGRLELQLDNMPLPGQPKTSALTVYSLVRAVRHAVGGICL